MRLDERFGFDIDIVIDIGIDIDATAETRACEKSSTRRCGEKTPDAGEARKVKNFSPPSESHCRVDFQHTKNARLADRFNAADKKKGKNNK